MKPTMDEEINNRLSRIRLICSTLHAVCGVPLWCYSLEGEVFLSTSPYEKELDTLFSAGGCKNWILSGSFPLETPVVMSDSLGLLWVGEFLDEVADLGKVLVVIGPVTASENAPELIDNQIRQMELSLRERKDTRQILGRIAVVPVPMLNQYTAMLHFTVTQKVIQPEEFLYQAGHHEELSASETEKHYLDYENDYVREELLLQCVREGNQEYHDWINSIVKKSTAPNYHTGDALRDAKDTVIIFLTQCCDAAIEGGLPRKTAIDLRTNAISEIENCHSITELSNLNHQFYARYIDQVSECRKKEGISTPIRMVCDYVKAHVTEPLELSDLAKTACYTEYYLTRKFRKEMGISLTDYIQDVRMEYAKIWLLSTNKSIQQISEELQFGSRNYFSRVFRNKEGLTPQEFRNRTKTVG